MLTLKCGSLAIAFHFRIGALRRSLGAIDPRERKMSFGKAPRGKQQMIFGEISCLSATRQQTTEQELSHGIARIQPDGGLGLSLGLGPAVELNQHKGKVRVMEGSGRIELQGALEFRNRLVEAPEPGVFHGQVAVRFGKIRVQSNRRGKFRSRARVVAGV